MWKDGFLREICAFANSQGGTLYVGVEDDGTIVGVNNAKTLLQDMPNKIKNNLGFLASIDLKEDNGKEFIAIIVNPQENAISSVEHARTEVFRWSMMRKTFLLFLIV